VGDDFMLIGYGRVSTSDQNLDLQIDALNKEGCDEIFTDVASGAKTEREGLTKSLNYIRKGDILVVWKLDRLGRSIQHLIQTVQDLETNGIGFRSLQENIDTQTSSGILIFHVFGALAEFERNLIRERTMAGLKAARARGRVGGRPKALKDSQIENMKKLYQDRNTSINEICDLFRISRTTLYKYINAAKAKDKEPAD